LGTISAVTAAIGASAAIGATLASGATPTVGAIGASSITGVIDALGTSGVVGAETCIYRHNAQVAHADRAPRPAGLDRVTPMAACVRGVARRASHATVARRVPSHPATVAPRDRRTLESVADANVRRLRARQAQLVLSSDDQLGGASEVLAFVPVADSNHRFAGRGIGTIPTRILASSSGSPVTAAVGFDGESQSRDVQVRSHSFPCELACAIQLVRDRDQRPKGRDRTHLESALCTAIACEVHLVRANNASTRRPVRQPTDHPAEATAREAVVEGRFVDHPAEPGHVVPRCDVEQQALDADDRDSVSDRHVVRNQRPRLTYVNSSNRPVTPRHHDVDSSRFALSQVPQVLRGRTGQDRPWSACIDRGSCARQERERRAPERERSSMDVLDQRSTSQSVEHAARHGDFADVVEPKDSVTISRTQL
jgi:hypothetical protein